MIRFLLERKADATNPVLIEAAALRSNTQIIDLLLERGANATNGMWGAVNGGNAATVSYLIGKNGDATTPRLIEKAVGAANAPVADVLLKSGAPKDHIDGIGQPLMILGMLTWKVDIVKTLLENGVNPDLKNKAGDTALHIVADDEASKGYPKFKQQKKGRLPMLEVLIAGKADINAVNAKGETVLKVADGGDVKKILEAAGASKKLPSPTKQ